ncbi:MAG: hypothetical protein FJ303_24540 [Planctomycetes bacterium]|nr:hypothetical protein [Planctomycetota bacterium]
MAEIIRCPNCQRELRLPDEFIGQTVQCPQCRHMFVATSTAVSSTPPTPPADQPKPTRPAYDEEDDDSRTRRRGDYYDDDDDSFDDISINRRRRRYLPPHRGGVIMALGLVALVGGMSLCGVPALLGPVAWGLGTWDLRQMREGYMDPDGESMTRVGQVCGMVATGIVLIIVLGCGFLFWAEGG